MKRYLLGAGLTTAISFLASTGWYLYFGYDALVTLPENLIAIYGLTSFWIGFLLWTTLYLLIIIGLLYITRNKSAASST